MSSFYRCINLQGKKLSSQGKFAGTHGSFMQLIWLQYYRYIYRSIKVKKYTFSSNTLFRAFSSVIATNKSFSGAFSSFIFLTKSPWNCTNITFKTQLVVSVALKFRKLESKFYYLFFDSCLQWSKSLFELCITLCHFRFYEI